VALVTDGRMSGASGKVPAAIHVTPEAVAGGWIGKVRNGDLLTLDCETQRLQVDVSDAELAARNAQLPELSANSHGMGRELFNLFRNAPLHAEEGASPLLSAYPR
jgi:phosphogluconate dehydratase